MGNYVYRAEFTNKSGVNETFTVETEDAMSMIADRTALLAAIETDVAAPKYNAPASKPEPMTAAAAASGFARGVMCPDGHGPKRHVNGGTSAKTNRPYPAFDVCDECGHKENSPK